VSVRVWLSAHDGATLLVQWDEDAFYIIHDWSAEVRESGLDHVDPADWEELARPEVRQDDVRALANEWDKAAAELVNAPAGPGYLRGRRDGWTIGAKAIRGLLT
jgi:hypothetical protein